MSSIDLYSRKAGEYNDLLFDILMSFIDSLYKQCSEIEIKTPIRIIGSTGLVIAKKLLGGSSKNYEYLHTVLYNESETHSLIRDWDIMFECPDEQQCFIISYIKSFFNIHKTDIEIPEYKFSKTENGISKIYSYNIPLFNEIVENPFTKSINKFLLKKFGQLMLKVDIIFINSIKSLKLCASNLSRNIYISTRGTSDMSIGLFNKKCEMKNYTDFSLKSLIETISCYKHFFTNVQDHTSSGDYYSSDIFISKYKKHRDFLNSDIMSYHFEQDFFNKIARFVLNDNEIMLCDYLKPKIIKLNYLVFNKDICKKINTKEITEDIYFEDCPYCCDKFTERSYVHISSCGHVFHAHCILLALSKYYIKLYNAKTNGLSYMIGENIENQMSCPVCRHDEWTIPLYEINELCEIDEYHIKKFFN